MAGLAFFLVAVVRGFPWRFAYRKGVDLALLAKTSDAATVAADIDFAMVPTVGPNTPETTR
jgi:hypothetical protein